MTQDEDSFVECAPADDARPVRQGDVFEWVSVDDDPWRQLGIVVTANCDIARAKHRGVLSYVPVLDLRSYLATFFLPSHLEKLATPLRGQYVKQVRAAQQDNLSGFTEPMSEEAALLWLRTNSPESLVEDLKIPDGKQRKKFLSCTNGLLQAEAALESSSYDNLFRAIAALRAVQSGDLAGAATKLGQQVHDHVVNLPGDAFYFGAIGRQRADGYVAYLRLVREIDQARIAVKPTDLRDSSVTAKRVAALESPYVFRLTQQLAEVFSSIGLPGTYEEARSATLNRLSALSAKALEPSESD